MQFTDERSALVDQGMYALNIRVLNENWLMEMPFERFVNVSGDEK